MFDPKTLHRSARDNRFYYEDLVTHQEVELKEMFPQELWDSPEAFKMAGIRGLEPMTAKELETEEMQDDRLADPENYLEEKFDGTRGLLHFLSQEEYETHQPMGFCRLFSRRISRETGFYVENSDRCPHLREIDVPELAGTVIDGELFINGLPFKEVSSTLNCLWDKAVDRQIEKGFVTFHAFDILFFQGIDVRKMPLHRRKEYLRYAVDMAGSPYIEFVPFYSCGTNLMNGYDAIVARVGEMYEEQFLSELEENSETYPNLWHDLHSDEFDARLSPRGFYELIVATGGEGLIVKSKNGRYYHKRGWEYSKIKKFLTRELIVMGFSEPTREYTGKDVKKWGYWVDEQNQRHLGNFYGDKHYTPVTRHYYYNQVGNLLLGVLIPKTTWNKMSPKKRGTAYDPSCFDLDPRLDDEWFVMQVCECAGFDDDTRAQFTNVRDKMAGKVVEVKANELFKDTGKMRHPRFLRVREDKEPERCTWEDHVGDKTLV